MHLPNYLYKVTTKSLYEASLASGVLALADTDEAFIHFCEEDDVQRVATKFFAGQEELVLVKVDPQLLEGKLVLEKNPGGEREYYHLYEGRIPMSAVVHTEEILAS